MMGWRCRNSASANRKHCIPITTGRHKKHGSALRNGLFRPQSQCDGATAAHFVRITSLSSAQYARHHWQKSRDVRNPHKTRVFYTFLSTYCFCARKILPRNEIAAGDFFKRDRTKKHQPNFFLHKHKKIGLCACRRRKIWTNRSTSDSPKSRSDIILQCTEHSSSSAGCHSRHDRQLKKPGHRGRRAYRD